VEETKRSVFSPSEDVQSAGDYYRLRRLCGDKFFNYLRLVHFDSREIGWKPILKFEQASTLLLLKGTCFYLEHAYASVVQNSNGGIIFVNVGWRALYFKILLYISTVRGMIIRRAKLK